ncbi:MAG TPA: hypothetical protein VNH18_34610 [Bryobacteraceae bacterium]|jgi:hypothetical protein|nr:hypothetical protein [Bryobacteraceae bacterium]HXJ44471.1 hypothetical protein [Bryobacteraceae bacterium]
MMESCDKCLRLEQRLRSESEYYGSLIVQHDQMIREGKPDARSLDHAIQKARRRRNAAGRLFLYHCVNHLAPRTTFMQVISITICRMGKLRWMRQSALPLLPGFRATEPEQKEVRTVAQYQVTAPMLAISDQEVGRKITVTIPVGAVLHDSTQPTTTLLGLVGVYWEGRHYSVSFRDLLKKAQCVRSA